MRAHAAAALFVAACWTDAPRVVYVERVRVEVVRAVVPCLRRDDEPPKSPCVVYDRLDLTCDDGRFTKFVCDDPDPVARQACRSAAFESENWELRWWIDRAWPRCRRVTDD